MRYLLSYNGWKAIEAASLSQATALLMNLSPQALILDLMLPDGNGIELLRRIRDTGQNVCVAVVTGVGDTESLDAVRALRPDVFFRKPVDVNALLQWLDSTKS